MKLAEALQERADLNRNIEQLRKRLNSNVLVQEGERTAEEPERLKRELDASVERLAYLISRINLTNSQTKVDGRTLTELIARKDALILKISVYKDIVYTGSQTSYRARNTEIKIKAAISVTDWQDEIDKMAKELRLLDNKLQENNWNKAGSGSRNRANVTRRLRKPYMAHVRARVWGSTPFLDRYAPIVYMCIVIEYGYYRTLTGPARAGTGKSS